VLDSDEAIAVVGLAAKVPGARDIEEYWLNLVRGRESVSVLSDEQLRAYGVLEELLSDPAYVKAASMVPDAEYFDAQFFRMTPREAEMCDPQIRLFLEVAHSAIENAGYDPASLTNSVGVFASAGPPHYAEQHLLPHPEIASSPGSGVVTLNHSDYVATTASYKLNLRGPSLTVLTACSSTLVALHLACQSLRIGDCDMALVGGADVEFPFGHGYLWGPGGVRSRDGHCRPFDAAATGTVFGGGACAVLIKRLSDALADHDHISAVIRGIALNNDGADKVSFGAPSTSGQTAVIMEAMALARLRPEDISYVEAHGTGTALGDPIEVAALTEAYTRLAGTRLPAGRCGIGSIKGNVGHLGPVAGIAGFIKAVLSLEREQLPRSINFTTPNPRLNLESTPFRVQDHLAAWPRDPQRPRRASVSSMGIGGSNVHVVLEEPPAQGYAGHAEEPRIVVWSGLTVEAERAARDRLAKFFTWRGEAVFADAVATLQHGRAGHPVRAAAVCTSAHDAAAVLGAADTSRVFTLGRRVKTPRPVSLLFPGQGSQHVGMARGLYRGVPAFAHALDGWFDLLESADLSLRDCWLGNVDGLDINDTVFAQPLLFAVEAALAQLWQEAGVRPVALLGHSIGELVAAMVAGIFAPADAAALVLARARAMRDLPAGGGMLAVATTEDGVRDLLNGTVTVAVVNGPDQTVLSGSADELERAAATLAARGISSQRLRTSDAFHTPMLDEAAAVFERAFTGIAAKPPTVPVYSAATGRQITPAEAGDSSFWARQLITPVRFADALNALLDTGEGVLVEAGPARVLTGLARRHPQVRQGHFAAVPSLPQHGGDDAADTVSLLTAAAHLWTEGHDIAWERVGQSPLRHRLHMPGYPYQRKRFWIDPPARGPLEPSAQTPPTTAAGRESTSHTSSTSTTPVAAADSAGSAAVADRSYGAPAAATATDTGPATTPFSTVLWTQSPAAPVALTRQGATAVVFLPDEPRRALDIVLALQQTGLRTVRARPASAYRSSGDEFGVRSGVAGDIRRMLDELAARGVTPQLLVHAVAAAVWSPTSTENVHEQLDQSFFGLLALIQHGLRTGATGRLPGLLTLVTGSVDVSGGDPVEPVKASLHGAMRTFAAEMPWLSCKLIDVSPNTPTEELRDELCRDDGQVVVALRGRRRWLPRERPLWVAPGQHPAVRRNGVYVITGGLGGLGLEMMRGLAASGLCPKIALLGRHVLPEGADRARLLAEGDEWTTRVVAAVEDATSVGAQVRLIPCDVGDVRQVRRALDVVAAHDRPVNGLLHLAGVAGDGMLQVRRPDLAAEVLRPKVLGTYVLAEALAGRPALDFVVFFSSRAAVDGLVGSGDYAAANAVLDLYARDAGLPTERVVSINFPSWAKVGMASRPPAPRTASQDSALRWETVLDQENTWALDEHRIEGRPLLPGTAHLDMVLRAYQESVPATDDASVVVVSDVAFSVPLTAMTGRHVRIDFIPDGERYRWAVLSRPDDDSGEAWVRHVTGRIERQRAGADKVDVETLRTAMTPCAVPDTAGAQRLFTLGPRWRAVRELRVSGDERLVELQLPAAFSADLDAHPLHPSLLDCATAATRDETEPFHVPFLYRRMIVFAPLPAELTSHVRRRPAATGLIVADVDLIDPDGRVLVHIEGFTMRQVDGSSFGDEPAAGAVVDATQAGRTSPSTRAQQPAPADPPGGSAAGADAAVGIDPAVGADLVLTLLSTRTPEQVVVRPFVGGRPVALPEPAGWHAEPAAGSAVAAPVVLPSAGVLDTAPATPVPSAPTQPPGMAAASTSPATGSPATPATPAALRPPSDANAPVVDRLRLLWSDTLGIDDIGLDDDFFDLGGNSLSAVELMSRVRDAFGVELNIGLLFDAPTLQQLTELLEQQATN
jgi:acyl transferase domain-containing protein/acyl carrier protein